MINHKEEVDRWNASISGLGDASLPRLIELGRHWMQIKILEHYENGVLGVTSKDEAFEDKMRGVSDFLSDLHKKIGQVK